MPNTAAESYLQDFHQRHAGATSATFLHFAAHAGTRVYASSYHLLAACVPETAETVLDLCCGDGALLHLLSVRSPTTNLIGVDFSRGELHAARAALPERVMLLEQRAQHLGIASASVDCVVSHMALMLMDDIETVVTEIARVLKNGGKFAAIVGRNSLMGPANLVFRDTFRQVARETGLASLPMGDVRARSVEGWHGLLIDRFENIDIVHVDVPCRVSPDAFWNDLTLTYDVDRLAPEGRALLHARFIQALQPLVDTDGTVETGWALALVCASIRHG